MTKSTLSALGAALIAIGQELLGEVPAAASPEQPPTGEATTKRRGRPANPETPATPPTEPGSTGKPESELRELIKPLVEDGRGEEVKKLIAKHGGTKLFDLPAAAHAAFSRDVEALTM